MSNPLYRYSMRLRPPGYATVPSRWPWVYVEAPASVYHAGRFREAFPDIPLCTNPDHRYGIIGSDVPLSQEQLDAFEIDPLP